MLDWIQLQYVIRRSLSWLTLIMQKKFKSKATYALTISQRVTICKWVKQLKLSDEYASNLGQCVDADQGKMHGMKSHDCHVPCNGCFQLHSMHYQNIFGSRLLKLATFQRTNFNNINVEHLRVMENNIHALLCKLEQIFPSSFFDSMKHLPIHLPYEARVGGLVQNCWMYPFERYETSKSFFKLVINHCIIYYIFLHGHSYSFLGFYTP